MIPILLLLGIGVVLWRLRDRIHVPLSPREEREAAARDERDRLERAGLEFLHVFGADLTPDRAWELFAWCLRCGADEFTVNAIIVEGGDASALAAFELAAAPDRVADGPRPNLYSRSAANVRLWRLTPVALDALRFAFPHGPFQYEPGDAWYEDPVLFRTGEMMLGIITHEAEGGLVVSAAERAELDSLGFKYRTKGDRVDI